MKYSNPSHPDKLTRAPRPMRIKAGLIDHDHPGAEQVMIRDAESDDYPIAIWHIDFFYDSPVYDAIASGEIVTLEIRDTGEREDPNF